MKPQDLTPLEASYIIGSLDGDEYDLTLVQQAKGMAIDALLKMADSTNNCSAYGGTGEGNNKGGKTYEFKSWL